MRVAAVDMGATSVRVAVIDLNSESPEVHVVHRWHHSPATLPDGSVRWRWGQLLENVRCGLNRARALGPLASIGIDGWAVDYGLVDEQGALLSDPHSYRSPRTEGWQRVAQSLDERELYRRTGIQLMPINTVFQLAAHDREELARARTLMMLPELVAHELTGRAVGERSNAATTGLLDVTTGGWARDLAAAIGVDPRILPPLEPVGSELGFYGDTPVHLVAAHDTACAFVASPLDGEGRALVSAGTWCIVGVERERADTSETARAANFSNEAGALGGYRYIRNVTGFWLLERCAAEWGTTTRDLLDLATLAPGAPLFDVGDECLLAPTTMSAEVRRAAGLDADTPTGVVARSIVESVAAAVADVLGELRRQAILVDEVAVVGGGAGSSLVLEQISRHAGVPAVPGAMEATALGNALIQGIALGRFEDIADGRRWLRAAQTSAG